MYLGSFPIVAYGPVLPLVGYLNGSSCFIGFVNLPLYFPVNHLFFLEFYKKALGKFTETTADFDPYVY